MRLFTFLALALACAVPGLANAQATQVACPAPAAGFACFQFPAGPVVNWSWAPPAPVGIAPAQLLDVIAKAKGGDTLALAPGVHPAVTIRGRAFSPALTVTSADPAHLAEIDGFDFLGSAGLVLDRLDIHRTNPLSAQSPVLNIVGSIDVLATRLKIRGTTDASGLMLGRLAVITGGSDITLADSDLSTGFKAIALADVLRASIRRNQVHGFRTAPIAGGGVLTGTVIDGNDVRDITPNRDYDDHSDCIHIQTTSDKVVDQLTVSNNTCFFDGLTGTLGINLQGTEKGGFTHVRVTGNVLHWNNNQALTTNWVRSGEISGNVLRAAPGLDNPAHCCGAFLRNRGPVELLDVHGNTLKDNSYMAVYRANTFLSPEQIAADGAAAAKP